MAEQSIRAPAPAGQPYTVAEAALEAARHWSYSRRLACEAAHAILDGQLEEFHHKYQLARQFKRFAEFFDSLVYEAAP